MPYIHNVVRTDRRIEYVYLEEMVDTVETLFTISSARCPYTEIHAVDPVIPSEEENARTFRKADSPDALVTAAERMEEPSSEDG